MKKIDIKVIPKAKKELVKEENGILKVYLTAPAIEGKANEALVECLSEYFHVKKRSIEITKGLKSRYKTINILEL
jgi:hypothetical protein